VSIFVVQSEVSYRDVHVFRIEAADRNQIEKIKALRQAFPTDHMWRSAALTAASGRRGGGLVHLAYPKQMAAKVADALNKENLRHKIVTRDLQDNFDRKRQQDTTSVPSQLRRGSDCKCCNETMLEDFRRYDEISAWLKNLAECKAGDKSLNLKTFDFGETFEKRRLNGIEIGAPLPGTKAKPTIWLHANEHAREWLAGSFAIYLINNLVHDSKYKALVDKIHWLIVPIANPDGYEFTHTKDRMWRKNRNPTHGLNAQNSCKGSDCKEKKCIGVDLNRNWDARWASHVDTSQDPCEYQVFDGPTAWSEVESTGARDKILEHKATMEAFFSIHTFGQLFLVPYSFSKTEVPPDYQEVLKVAKEAASKMSAVHKTNWTAGTSPNILYAVSGSGMDWAKLNGVKYSYTLELRPKDDPTNDGASFVAPKTDIIPSGEEVIVGIEHVANRVIKEWDEKHPKKLARMADAPSKAQ